MSFFLTTPQMLARTKTVTRRLKCRFRIGERFIAIEKGQGLKKGQKQHVLGVCEVTEISHERLSTIFAYDDQVAGMNYETTREGFPRMMAHEFVTMFCKNMKCIASDLVYRIAFQFVDCSEDQG